MSESLQHRLTFPPDAEVDVNVVRIGESVIRIPNTVVSQAAGTLVVKGELSAQIRGLLAEAGVQIEPMHGRNGTSGNGMKNGRTNGARPTLDELFGTLVTREEEAPVEVDPDDLFAQHMDLS